MTHVINFIDSEPKPPEEESEDGSVPEGAKIIFLDLEGVVVTHKTIIVAGLARHIGADPENLSVYHGTFGEHAESQWTKFVDPFALGMLIHACHKHGCQIVVTSTLRSADWILTKLIEASTQNAGHDTSRFFHKDWRTDNFGNREEEITHWLAKHEQENITHWAAVDDRSLKLPKRMCRVDPREGFSYVDYLTLELMLTDRPYKPEAIFL